MTRVLVVGASGALGSAATRDLLQKGFSVRAFVRNKSKAHEIEKAGAEVFIADITNPGAITESCKDIDVVITATNGMIGKGNNSSKQVDDLGHRNLIDSAVKTGVKLFVYTSVNDASRQHPIDFFRTKYDIEQYLINSGLNYTILRLPAFMEWHVHNLLGKSIQEKGKTIILGSGNNPTNFIAVRDVVNALELIIGNEQYHNKIIQIAGPENLSRNEIATLYGKLLNITPRVTHVPRFALQFFSKLVGLFHPGIARILKLSAYGDTADLTMNTSLSIQQFGLSPTTVESFIREKVSTRQ